MGCCDKSHSVFPSFFSISEHDSQKMDEYFSFFICPNFEAKGRVGIEKNYKINDLRQKRPLSQRKLQLPIHDTRVVIYQHSPKMA
jgi:hypothetical protein